MPDSGDEAAEQCPVDHRTREKWLEAAKAKGEQPPRRPSPPSPSQRDVLRQRLLAYRFSLDRGQWEPLRATRATSKRPVSAVLDKQREISTIPRAVSGHDALNSAEKAALPANSELDTGHDRDTGNWVYPSQEMFFNAMQRKGHEAHVSDMASIVPIHNAVNERAWAEIKAWEAGKGAEACGGPRLVSFSGDSKALTPRAWWNTLVGYSAPFDRHDWVVDRCGKKIEYVIDFYSGKGNEGLKGLNFYLDVRPKLNSWEGIKMRLLRSLGGS